MLRVYPDVLRHAAALGAKRRARRYSLTTRRPVPFIISGSAAGLASRGFLTAPQTGRPRAAAFCPSPVSAVEDLFRSGRHPAALGLRGLRRSVREAKRESRGEQGLTPVMVHLHTGPGRLLARTPAASKLASLVVSPKLSGAPAPNRATRATIAFPVAVGKTTQNPGASIGEWDNSCSDHRYRRLNGRGTPEWMIFERFLPPSLQQWRLDSFTRRPPEERSSRRPRARRCLCHGRERQRRPTLTIASTIHPPPPDARLNGSRSSAVRVSSERHRRHVGRLLLARSASRTFGGFTLAGWRSCLCRVGVLRTARLLRVLSVASAISSPPSLLDPPTGGSAVAWWRRSYSARSSAMHRSLLVRSDTLSGVVIEGRRTPVLGHARSLTELA